MKVKIGEYRSFFGPYQLAEKLCFWAKDEEDEYGFPHKPDWVHNFGEWLAYGKVRPEPEVGEVTDMFDEDRKATWLYKFLLWVHELKGDDEQRVKVRIDRWDTWSMDHTLGYIILPMLKDIKEHNSAAPHVDDEDVPVELRSTAAPEVDKRNGETDEHYFKRWEYVLDEMIFAFETKGNGANVDWEEQFSSGNIHFQTKKLENGMSEMIKGPNDTSKTDWEGRKAYGERVQNGFRLFGKYYQNLWR